ncbi:MAG TPA: hypothetical protein VKQ11_23945 [Candidatus Sulfotelmatobacter sp.]|nr:hypothetical protein [Candidatus Sulfotelmatobacter sp.]
MVIRSETIVQSESTAGLPPRLWPSLLIAAILATVLPVVWLSLTDPFGLKLIFAPIYIPVAFGIFWPVIVALQRWTSLTPEPWLPRHKAATIVFLASLPFCGLILRMEVKEEMLQRAEELRGKREADQRAKEHEAARSAAQEALAARGPLGFTEPLKPAEATAIAGYIYGHRDMSAEELLRMSEHYQDPTVMYDLARHKSCPPEALRILYDKAIAQAKAAPFAQNDVDVTLTTIAGHPNTPPEILGTLLTVDSSVRAVQNARSVALENPHVPKSKKIAYVRTLCGSSKQGFHSQYEGRFAASDADTPPEVLECLAGDQYYSYFVASNPHAPINVLEWLAQSGLDAATRKEAQENLARQGAERK